MLRQIGHNYGPKSLRVCIQLSLQVTAKKGEIH